MTCKEIYNAALHLIAQNDIKSDIRDYDERFPYLMATFCAEAEWLDDAYRASHGKDIRGDYPVTSLGFGETFPLCDVFASAASYYVAAMLIIDENETFSDSLFDKYSARMSSIADSLPMKNEPIKNIYP
ncbi:MAG: hypothetical protein ACI4QZ_03110 [Eubacteriales bacterium]